MGLRDLDAELMQLLAERSAALADVVAEKSAGGKFSVDPELEKSLWRVWEKESLGSLPSRMLRRLFALANGLAYEMAKSGPGRVGGRLYPVHRPSSIDIPGPTSPELARMWLFMAAATGSDMTLAPVLVNDRLFDMMRMLRQAGAAMELEEDEIIVEPRSKPLLKERTLFVGEDECTLYLAAALMLPFPGRYTLAGGSILKAADLGPFIRTMADLDVRITPIEPHSTGLPIRLESPGVTGGRCRIDPDLPAEATAALLLAGAFLEDGLTLEAGFEQTDESQKAGSATSGFEAVIIKEAMAILAACGVEAGLEGETAFVSAGSATPPKRPDLWLDFRLSSFLLALPLFFDTTVRLSGVSQPGAASTDGEFALLKAAGLKVVVDEDGIAGSMGEQPSSMQLDCRNRPGLAPLASVLAAGGAPPAILLYDESPEFWTAQRLLQGLGYGVSARPGRMEVTSKPPTPIKDLPSDPFPTPDPLWRLALASLSFAAPGIRPSDERSLSVLWPDFRRIFAELFEASAKDEGGDDEPARSKRRVRIG